MASSWFVLGAIVFSAIILAELLRLNIKLFNTLKKEQFLSPAPKCSRQSCPLISVLVPARDEGNNIEEAAKSILDSDYEDLELILVDDRSSDDTLRLMRQIAKNDHRVKVVSINNLPESWTGKTHALSEGVQSATGEIFLFIDADSVISRHLISRAVNHLLTLDLDMLSLAPGFTHRGFLENAVHPHLALGLSSFYPLMDINDVSKSAGLASGCFLMITKKAYEKAGTWKAFRTEVTEDIALSKALKRKGMRLNFLRGGELVQTKPFRSFPELAAFWQRTFYGGLEQSIMKHTKLCLNYFSLLALFAFLIYSIGVIVGGNPSTEHWILCALSALGTCAVMIPYGVVVEREHGSGWYGFSAPIGIALSAWVALSMLLMLLTKRGIHWRGSVYK
jgi:cellulose synthase/poly-beta-1,6-N-acetylglucosamine synthase-like glycosyltransferase